MKSAESTATTRYYRSYSDDFVTSPNQDFELPADYRWIDSSLSHRAGECVALALGRPFAATYCQVNFRLRIVGREAIAALPPDEGFFLYANHTQPTGDACTPLLVARPRRAYVVVSPANLGIPCLGRALPYLGALPIADTVAGTKELRAAVAQRIGEGSAVTIYPEAHVWPWHTGIRPLPTTSFTFPVDNHCASFAMTATYQPRDGHEAENGGAPTGKPRMTLYVDGPFYPDETLPRRARKEALRDEVQACMEARSALSTYSYISYKPALGGDAA